MAKGKKNKQHRATPAASAAKVSANDPLGDGLATFAAGDYPAARAHLSAKADSGTLNEVDQKRAEDLLEATKLDTGTLWTALACAGFFGIAIAIGIAVQP